MFSTCAPTHVTSFDMDFGASWVVVFVLVAFALLFAIALVLPRPRARGPRGEAHAELPVARVLRDRR